MTKDEYIKNCLYFKGEQNNPYSETDYGKSFWWNEEMGGLECSIAAVDEKKERDLSKHMIGHIQKHWEDNGITDSFWDTGRKRATELYQRGLWSFDYTCSEDVTIEKVIRRNEEYNTQLRTRYDSH